MKGFQCTRCNHIWIPRNKGKPLVCPKCKSPYWDKLRQSETKKKVNWKQKRRMT